MTDALRASTEHRLLFAPNRNIKKDVAMRGIETAFWGTLGKDPEQRNAALSKLAK
jgi:hypothetical protein